MTSFNDLKNLLDLTASQSLSSVSLRNIIIHNSDNTYFINCKFVKVNQNAHTYIIIGSIESGMHLQEAPCSVDLDAESWVYKRLAANSFHNCLPVSLGSGSIFYLISLNIANE